MNREQAKVWAGLTKEQLTTVGKTSYAEHLDVIRKFAEGAEVEYQYKNNIDRKWYDCETGSPNNYDFFQHKNYRVKKPMRTINGFEVPAPLKVMPAKEHSYWHPSVGASEYYEYFSFTGDNFDRRLFERGLMFSNKEDAIANAKAMLGIDPYKED